MAEKRMFAKKIIDSDVFLGMPLSTQSLYFHLCMRADDDGFIDNPKSIQRTIGAADDDMRILVAKNFIIPFESGVIVIRHWKMHNYIQKDRYKETEYINEKALLETSGNKAYSLLDTNCIQDVSNMDTECVQPVSNSCPQYRLDKRRIEEISVEESREEIGSGEECFAPIPDFPPEDPPEKPARKREKRFVKPTLDQIREYIAEKGLSVDAEHFFDHYESNGWKVGRTAMKDWKATLRNWDRKEGDFTRGRTTGNGSRDILGDMIRNGAFRDD